MTKTCYDGCGVSNGYRLKWTREAVSVGSQVLEEDRI